MRFTTISIPRGFWHAMSDFDEQLVRRCRKFGSALARDVADMRRLIGTEIPYISVFSRWVRTDEGKAQRQMNRVEARGQIRYSWNWKMGNLRYTARATASASVQLDKRDVMLTYSLDSWRRQASWERLPWTKTRKWRSAVVPGCWARSWVDAIQTPAAFLQVMVQSKTL